MEEDKRLYNSRVIKTYVEYLNKYYPDVDIDRILSHAGIARYEIEDPGQWFNQRQINHFHEMMNRQTGNTNIAREVGRYVASADAFGPLKTYIMGMLTPATAYNILQKVASSVSRHITFQIIKIESNKIEVRATPRPGVHEKKFQCENRIGMLESLMINPLINKMATVEHDKCIHKGDEYCRYFVSWPETPSLGWKRLRNISFLLCAVLSPVLLVTLSGLNRLIPILVLGSATAAIAFFSEHIETKELRTALARQSDTADALINETNMRYNNALLVQELGQASATILNIEELCTTMMEILEKHLYFDRGVIMLADEEKQRLVYKAGYGYTHEVEQLLRQNEYNLDNPHSKGPLVAAFIQKKPILVDNLTEIKDDLSQRSQKVADLLNAQSLICVPIVYEKESLGVLCVDNIKSQRALTQSDLNLLMGLASQVAMSVTNALSFQRLKTSENRYRTIFESTSNALIIIEEDGTISLANTEFAELSGYPKDQIEGKKRWTDFIVSDDIEKFQQLSTQLTDLDSASDNYELRFTDKGGVIKSIFLTLSHIPDTRQSVIFILDITSQKKEAREKKKLEVQLHQAQKMESIGTLAGGIAHDFNNLLMGIQGNASLMLLDIDESHPHHVRLKNVEKYVQNGAELTKQLLGFARGGKYEITPTNLNDLIHENAEMFGRTKKEIKIYRKYETDIWTVDIDRGQIDQVFLNMYVNAWQAMPNGGELYIETRNVILTRIEVQPYKVKPGRYVKISIQDTGVGMDELTQKRIFDPFFTTKEMGRGTGLGLASAYGIIVNHGGIINVESRKGEGTRFNIYLPASEKNVVVEKKNEQEPLKTIIRGSESILLVDDEEMIIQIGRKMLEKLGYRVLTAQSGRKATGLYRENQDTIALVILDMIMPGMSGGETFDVLKHINPGIKVLLSSGYSIDGQAQNIIQRGCKGFIQKPFSISELSMKIRDIIGGAKTPTASDKAEAR